MPRICFLLILAGLTLIPACKRKIDDEFTELTTEKNAERVRKFLPGEYEFDHRRFETEARKSAAENQIEFQELRDSDPVRMSAQASARTGGVVVFSEDLDSARERSARLARVSQLLPQHIEPLLKTFRGSKLTLQADGSAELSRGSPSQTRVGIWTLSTVDPRGSGLPSRSLVLNLRFDDSEERLVVETHPPSYTTKKDFDSISLIAGYQPRAQFLRRSEK